MTLARTLSDLPIVAVPITGGLSITGNVGIGNSSPIMPLDVTSNVAAYGIRIRGRSSDNASILQFTNVSASTETANIRVDNVSLSISTNQIPRVRIDNSSGNLTILGNIIASSTQTFDIGTSISRIRNVWLGNINLSGGASVGGSISATSSIFSSSTISTNGGLLGSTAGNGLSVVGFATLGGPLYFCQMVACDPNLGSPVGLQGIHQPGVYAAARLHAQGQSFDFRGDGNAYKVGGGVWADLSDIRAKDNIISYTVGLDVVNRIQPKIYSFIPETNRDPNKRFIGAIAQEIETIAPEMVTIGPTSVGNLMLSDGRNLDSSPLPWILVNAVKELSAKIDELTARIIELESKT